MNLLPLVIYGTEPVLASRHFLTRVEVVAIVANFGCVGQARVVVALHSTARVGRGEKVKQDFMPNTRELIQ